MNSGTITTTRRQTDIDRSTAYQLGVDDYEAGYEYRGYKAVPAHLEVDYADGYRESAQAARDRMNADWSKRMDKMTA